MKLFVYALFCLKFLCAAAAGIAPHPGDELYVFPGQGTCVMYFTEIDGISTAVVSDAGAFNGVHPKFTVGSEELALLRPKPQILKAELQLCEELGAPVRSTSPTKTPLKAVDINTTPHKTKKPLPEDIDDAAQSDYTTPPRQRGRECSPETVTESSAQKQKTTINFEGKIQEAFAKFNVKRILCFFSHCDADHWNLHDFLPTLPTIYVMGRGWSNDKLDILRKPNSYVFKMNQEVTNIGFGDYVKSKKHRLEAFAAMGFSDSYIGALNSIHLWGVNLCPTSGRNENSMLLSFTSEQLNKTFFMTGDATVETFDALEEKGIDPNALLKAKYPDDSNHLVFAVVPHHGSSATFPPKFLTMVNPDAFIFTAGRGAAYGHPRMDVVEKLLQSPSRRVYDRYNMVYPVSFLGFHPTREKGPDARYKPIDIKLTVENPLILGTNVSQRLRFSKDGVFQEFNPFLDIDGSRYTWDYCNHAYEARLNRIRCVAKMRAPKIAGYKGNIGYDNEGTPVAYFVQINAKLWYGYPIESTQ